MPVRDFLTDQIEKMGKVLSEILDEFLGIKLDGNTPEGIEIANERFWGELGIEINELLMLEEAELSIYLKDRILKPDHLELISDYLYEVGEYYTTTDKLMAKLYLEKAIDILDLADNITETFSFERMNRKSVIERLIKTIVQDEIV